MNPIAPARKPDRRTERTRQLLRDALMELIVEKGYEAISIQDITDRADVARPTFYFHYTDKEDLLFNSLREVYDEMTQSFGTLTDADVAAMFVDKEQVDAVDFEHVARHSDFYRVMLSKKGSIAFLMQVIDYLGTTMSKDIVRSIAEPGVTPSVPAEAVGAFMAAGQIGLIDWWLRKGTAYTPNEMAQIMFILCAGGLNWALNLDLPKIQWRVDEKGR